MSTGAGIRIGLDIGGTSLKAVRVSAAGDIEDRVTLDAGGAIPREALLARVAETVAALARGDRAASIGIAVGGLVRPNGTMPSEATNLPNLVGVALAPLFSGRLGAPCHVLNDAQAAMHGEAWRGAARGKRNALLVTLGTGIGGGLLLDGKVRRGAHGAAGEMGVWPLERGQSLETIAAPGAFERRTGVRLGDLIVATTRTAEVERALDALGRALAAAHLLLDLEAIVLSGSVTAVGQPLQTAVEGAVRRYLPAAFDHGLEIVIGTLGAYAGAIGAVAPGTGEAA
jgi:glucokinase